MNSKIIKYYIYAYNFDIMLHKDVITVNEYIEEDLKCF